MSILVTNLAEIMAGYGLHGSPVTVDNQLCLATRDGLVAVHIHSGDQEEIAWAGKCLWELRQRGVRGLGAIHKTLRDHFVLEVDKVKFYLTEYTPGGACDSSSIFEVRAIGRVIGQVHRASEEILYLSACPAIRVAPQWREAARERVAYWGIAAHRYRQGERGEAVRQLLRQAEESLSRVDELALRHDGARVISFAELTYSHFVYMNAEHQVYLNQSHKCNTDWAYIAVGNMLLDGSFAHDRGLHFLASYIAVYPFSEVEWQLLMAYLLYPHEWATALDELVRGRPALKSREVLVDLRCKNEWIEWLKEEAIALRRGVHPSPPALLPEPPLERVEISVSTPALEAPREVENSIPKLAGKITWKKFPTNPGGKGKSR